MKMTQMINERVKERKFFALLDYIRNALFSHYQKLMQIEIYKLHLQ